MMNDIPTWGCQDWVMESLDLSEVEEPSDVSTYDEARMGLERLSTSDKCCGW